jgi:hypothetical protein
MNTTNINLGAKTPKNGNKWKRLNINNLHKHHPSRHEEKGLLYPINMAI